MFSFPDLKDTTQTGYIRLVAWLLGIFATIYLVLHFFALHNSFGEEAIQLKAFEVEYVVERLNLKDSSTTRKTTTTTYIDTNKKAVIITTISPCYTPEKRIKEIMDFLGGNHPEWVIADRTRLETYYRSLVGKSTSRTIESRKILVRSFFWLHGYTSYWEVIFWSIIGVLTCLLFTVSTVIRDEKQEFKPDEIPYQLAKLGYAPFISLILIFAYQTLIEGKGVDLESSNGLLTASFLLGFYSGRAIELLNKIKELFLPFTSAGGTPAGSDAKPYVQPASPSANTLTLKFRKEDLPNGTNESEFNANLANAVVSCTNVGTTEKKTLKVTDGKISLEGFAAGNYQFTAIVELGSGDLFSGSLGPVAVPLTVAAELVLGKVQG